MNKKKIGVVTGTRAEYYLLTPLLYRVADSDDCELQLYVTGAHLSAKYGNTYKDIKQDGFHIFKTIPILQESDTNFDINMAMSRAIQGFNYSFCEGKPDILILLGDRYELICAAVVAMNLKIPIAHINGGDTTEGAIDEAIRHSISKMSYLHFTTCEPYKKRVIQLGEDPSRVYNVGSLGVECINSYQRIGLDELGNDLGIDLHEPFAVVTFHPVTLEPTQNAKSEFLELLHALDDYKDLKIIFTKSNADSGGLEINELIDKYTEKNKGRCVARYSLGMKRYYSALSYACVMIGNSSSGILESPSFALPTINIGDRQKGRIQAENIIDCRADKKEISHSIAIATSDEFRRKIIGISSPYGNGNTSKTIFDIIVDFLDNKNWNIKKTFYNIDFEV